MSRLAELIEQLCPDGVEYRALGDVGSFVRGGGLQKADFVEAGMPCVHYGQIHTRFGTSATKAVSYVSEAQFARLKHAEYGDLLIATTSEDDEAVGKATAWLGDGEVAISGDMFYYRHNLEPKYVSYFFASSSFQEQKRPYLTGAKVRRIADKGLSRIQIPVPPVEIQREIVRILDQFTTLEAELEAELEARQAQYEHYRNHLLSYDSLAARGPVEMVKLGEYIKLSFGERITKLHDAGTRYPVYGGGGASFMTDSFNRSDEFVISRFALSEVCVRFVPGEFWLLDSGITFDVNESRCVKHYIGQFLLSRQIEIYRKSAGAAQRNLKTAEFLSMGVPLPCLSEQQRIADLLDRFDALVNDISSGLPAEIAARRAQYEHYRDRLLSFPEKLAD